MRFLRFLLVAVCLVAGILLPGLAPAEPYLTGIDVSHWQGKIDWTAVRADPQGVAFVVARATAGRTTVDGRYGENRTGALSHGLLLASYHFAYPDSQLGDALAEADHFVDTARLADDLADDRVIPVLDLEQDSLQYWSGTTAQLIAWTRTWLDQVHLRTGLHAMIYTNPSFWSTRMGDTRAFADAGYPLWIAHWGADVPTVPAGNWGGKGWRCWQYSSTGRVSGIPANVDMNRLDPASLARAL